MQRAQLLVIREDLREKMVLLSGPRQVGKTTLAKQLAPRSSTYLNYDSRADRTVILAGTWQRDRELLILDELHKLKRWKTWLKGLYDTEPEGPAIIVTVSARLDSLRKGGDSLAGRYFRHRLHPLSVAELAPQMPPAEALDGLLRFGGFPEPFFKASERAARRWRSTHSDVIIREDVRDLSRVSDLRAIETLAELLAARVGSAISYANLAGDLQVSPHTIKSWIEVLEALYVVFRVTPYTRQVARSILKEPKLYFYDTGRVAGEAARFENAIAAALLKRNHYLEDTQGDRRGLFYLRDKERREVDFFTTCDSQPELLVEAKLSDREPSIALRRFHELLVPRQTVQVVKDLPRELHSHGIRVQSAAVWLRDLEA